MKPSNGKNSTPVQFLEYLRQRRGMQHARRIRDQLGWATLPAVMLWSLRHLFAG